MSAPVRKQARPLASRDVAAFKTEVARWASRIGVQPRRIQIQRMSTKWASCSSAGRLCFSRDLLRKDAAFQQVVIVHELLHLSIPNHGKLFKSLLTAYVPGWERVSRNGLSRVCAVDEER